MKKILLGEQFDLLTPVKQARFLLDDGTIVIAEIKGDSLEIGINDGGYMGGTLAVRPVAYNTIQVIRIGGNTIQKVREWLTRGGLTEDQKDAISLDMAERKKFEDA